MNAGRAVVSDRFDLILLFRRLPPLELALYLLQRLALRLRHYKVREDRGRGGEARERPEGRGLAHPVLHGREQLGDGEHQAPVHHDGHAAGNTLGFRRKYLAYYRERHGPVTDREDNVEESEAGQRQPAEGAHVTSFVLELEIVPQDAQTNGHHRAGYYQERLSAESEGRRDGLDLRLSY